MYRAPGSGVKSNVPLSEDWGVRDAMLTVVPANIFEATTVLSPSTRRRFTVECVAPRNAQVKTASLAVKLVRHSPSWFTVTTSEGTHPSSPRTTGLSICNLRSTSIIRWSKASIRSANEVLLCSISTLAMRPSSALNRSVSGELACSTPAATRFSRLSRRAAICWMFASTEPIVPELVSITDWRAATRLSTSLARSSVAANWLPMRRASMSVRTSTGFIWVLSASVYCLIL